MKKIIYSLLFLLCCYNVYSQKIEVIEKTVITKNLEKKSKVLYTAITEKNELICVKEKSKKLSSNTNYTFYHYNANRELINTVEFKTDKIDKVFLAKDSIYLIKHKKNFIPNNSSYKISHQNRFRKVKNIDLFYQSASLKDLNFKEHHWSSIKNNGKHWNTSSEDFEIILDEDDTKKRLLRMSLISYNPTKEEVHLADINIAAKDSLKRTKHYSLHLQLDIFDETLKSNFSKKVILTNNIGKFKLEKYKVHTKNNNVYLLFSTLDIKKKKLISFESKLISFNNNLNTKYHIVKISSDTLKYKTIGDDTHSIATLNMDVFENKIICAGMYSNTDNHKINGFCRFDFNTTTLNNGLHSYLKFTNHFFEDIDASKAKFTRFIKEKNTTTKLKDTSVITKINKDYIKLKSLSSDFMNIDTEGNCVVNIEEYEIKKNSLAMPEIPGTPGMPGMPGMPLGNGISIYVNNAIKSEKRQLRIHTAKISKDHKLIWARNINLKESKERQYLYTNINGINYFIKNNIPRTHKQYNKKDYDHSFYHYLYAISVNDLGEIQSQRFSPYKPSLATTIELINGVSIINNSTNFIVGELHKKKFQLSKMGVK